MQHVVQAKLRACCWLQCWCISSCADMCCYVVQCETGGGSVSLDLDARLARLQGMESEALHQEILKLHRWVGVLFVTLEVAVWVWISTPGWRGYRGWRWVGVLYITLEVTVWVLNVTDLDAQLAQLHVCCVRGFIHHFHIWNLNSELLKVRIWCWLLNIWEIKACFKMQMLFLSWYMTKMLTTVTN